MAPYGVVVLTTVRKMTFLTLVQIVDQIFSECVKLTLTNLLYSQFSFVSHSHQDIFACIHLKWRKCEFQRRCFECIYSKGREIGSVSTVGNEGKSIQLIFVFEAGNFFSFLVELVLLMWGNEYSRSTDKRNSLARKGISQLRWI